MTKGIDFGATLFITLAILVGVLASFSPDALLSGLGSLHNMTGG